MRSVKRWRNTTVLYNSEIMHALSRLMLIAYYKYVYMQNENSVFL